MLCECPGQEYDQYIPVTTQLGCDLPCLFTERKLSSFSSDELWCNADYLWNALWKANCKRFFFETISTVTIIIVQIIIACHQGFFSLFFSFGRSPVTFKTTLYFRITSHIWLQLNPLDFMNIIVDWLQANVNINTRIDKFCSQMNRKKSIGTSHF